MIDNILFQDGELVMTIATQSSGSSNKVLYPDIFGYTLIIATSSVGSSTNILYIQPLVEYQTLVIPERIAISYS